VERPASPAANRYWRSTAATIARATPAAAIQSTTAQNGGHTAGGNVARPDSCASQLLAA
jgi:hypothetical protein